MVPDVFILLMDWFTYYAFVPALGFISSPEPKYLTQ